MKHLDLTWIKLTSLRENLLKGNSKKHDIDKIINSLKRYGFQDPIKLDSNLNKGNGGIVEGNGRLQALLQMKANGLLPPKNVRLGEDRTWLIPVLVGADLDSEEQAIAYSLDHNASTLWGSELNQIELFDNDRVLQQLKELAEENQPLFIVEAEDSEKILEELASKNEENEEKVFGQFEQDELTEDDRVETRAQSGDIWELGQHRLLCWDSTDRDRVEEFIKDRQIELLFTSPPYADMRRYEDGTDISLEKLTQFIPSWQEKVNYFVINLGLKFQDGEVIPYWQEYIDVAKQNGLKMLAWNVWDKKQAGQVSSACNMFFLTHEWLFVFGKERKKINRTVPNQTEKYKKRHGKNVFSKGTKTHVRESDGSVVISSTKAYTHHQIHSVLNLYADMTDIRKEHPAVYPVGLPFNYIEAMTDKQDIIADPFLGSGTTLIAAEQSDRICYGCEISPKYCDVIIARWEKLTDRLAKLQQNLIK